MELLSFLKRSLFFNKAACRIATYTYFFFFLKKIDFDRSFPLGSAKFFTTGFLQKTSRRLLLKGWQKVFKVIRNEFPTENKESCLLAI